MASELVMEPDLRGARAPQRSSRPGKRTWAELRKSVRDTRKLMTSLASSVPTSFTFRAVHLEQATLTRLYFLGIPMKDSHYKRDNTLMYVDIPENGTVAQLPWEHLLEASGAMVGQSRELSREEQLMRERQRLGSYGITSYDCHQTSGRFVFPAGSQLYTFDDLGKPEEPSMEWPVATELPGARLDPKLCPSNPDLLAFIHNNDVWVTLLREEQELRLTFADKGTKRLEQEPLSAGVPSFVVQEEFDRFTGYWWEPVAHQLPNGNQGYRILYEEIDESGVEIHHIFSSTADEKDIDDFRYPRAGTQNAKSSLKMVEFQVANATSGPTEHQEVGLVVEKKLYRPLNLIFPWMEYLVRTGWTPYLNYVYVVIMDRRQRRIALVLIHTDCFVAVGREGQSPSYQSLPELQVIYEETSDVWINVHDLLYFFPQTLPTLSEVSFLWCTEKSGFRHLMMVNSQLEQPSQSPPAANPHSSSDDDEGCVSCTRLQETMLTSGDWEVLAKQLWVDERRQLVFFMATRDSVLETHLYAVPYTGNRHVIRLTEPGYSHAVSLNKDCTMFVTVYSSVQVAPQGRVYRLTYTEGGFLSTKLLGVVLSSQSCVDYRAPNLFEFPSSSGHMVYGMVYRPHNQEPGVRYPTVLFVYGGPQVQLVTNSFKGLKFLRLHTLASQGFAVVVIDGRGSCNRGLRLESHLKNRLGTVEIADQVEGLQWLSANTDFIDLSRVAIHGWSYGGYLSLMGLAQRPDIFKVAIAGAPVVSWDLYDTGYTERYMDLPCTNTGGYTQGNVLSYVDRFPDEENRLLIIHGLIDENVHFQHSSRLINALVHSCKPYHLQVYPNERHGIRSHESSEHYKTLIVHFLQQHL